MNISLASLSDYQELANMRWEHLREDDIDYKENNIDNIDKETFIKDFINF
ncbi:MAG: hypothetical protein IJR82_05655 [Bacilli bacterium]|nr:hypothetical protein [Bacilli bacterium]